jgi:anthranilate phosphoribosyltransferase
MKDLIRKITNRENLSRKDAMRAMEIIMNGEATEAQIGAFLASLRVKGETIEEITGCAVIMREKAERIKPKADYYIDTCGTGGDGVNTFNISTAAAFVAAAGGVKVAKHGNRSVSSNCGCADVLEALGVNIMLKPDEVCQCIDNIGIGFLFAPSFHKSMKYAAVPRRELGIKTIFNIMGPLTNPANAKGQLMGVFDKNLVEPIANVLLNLGLERAMVIHGFDGMDEITLCERSFVAEVKNGEISTYNIEPEKFGLNRVCKEELQGTGAIENAEVIRNIFDGKKGSKRDIVLLNSAAAFYVGKEVDNLNDGVVMAAEVIDSGKAKLKLDGFIEFTNRFKN